MFSDAWCGAYHRYFFQLVVVQHHEFQERCVRKRALFDLFDLVPVQKQLPAGIKNGTRAQRLGRLLYVWRLEGVARRMAVGLWNNSLEVGKPTEIAAENGVDFVPGQP